MNNARIIKVLLPKYEFSLDGLDCEVGGFHGGLRNNSSILTHLYLIEKKHRHLRKSVNCMLIIKLDV